MPTLFTISAHGRCKLLNGVRAVVTPSVIGSCVHHSDSLLLGMMLWLTGPCRDDMLTQARRGATSIALRRSRR